MSLAPNLLLAGCQKCGTSGLAKVLAQHSEIKLSKMKEPNTFLKSDETTYPAAFAESYSLNHPERYRLDASVFYIASLAALERAQRWCGPETRVLVVIRHPVQRSLSAYLHLKKRGAEMRSFNEVFSRLPEQLSQIYSYEVEHVIHGIANKKIDLFKKIYPHDELWINALYVSNSIYSTQIAMAEKIFGKKAVYTIIFEELIKDSQTIVDGVCKFLELDASQLSDVELGRHNQTFLPDGISIEGNMNAAGQVMKRVRKALGVAKSRAVDSTSFPLEQRQSLHRLFEPEIDRLSEHLGRDLHRLWTPPAV